MLVGFEELRQPLGTMPNTPPTNTERISLRTNGLQYVRPEKDES